MDNITMSIKISIDSTTQEEKGIAEDTNDPGGACMFHYKYPLENQDQYKAKINFTIMEIVPPQAKGDIKNEHWKTAQKLFKNSKAANKNSKDAYRLANKSKQAAASARNYLENGKFDENQTRQIQGGIDWAESNFKSSLEKYNKEREKSLEFSKKGSAELMEGSKKFLESTEYTDREVIPKDVPNVQLYLPVGFQQNDGFNIAGTELGLLGAGVLAGASSGKSIVSSTLNEFSKGLTSIFDMAVGNLTGSKAAVVGARLANKLAPKEVSEAYSIAAGVTVNPNLRNTFRGVNLREFTFQFKFLPKSQSEAKEVESIIKHFRTHSYPEIISIGPVAAGYKFPSLFRIAVYVEHEEMVAKDIGDIAAADGEEPAYELVTKRKRVGNRMKDCYLRSVTTNYNPSSMAFHPDGRPVEIDLSLSFAEEVTLSRSDIEQGY
jgi:hypothetical protein